MEASQFSAVCVKLSLDFASILQPLGIKASHWIVTLSIPVCISVKATLSIFQ